MRYRVRYETPSGQALTTVIEATSKEDAKEQFNEWSGGPKAGFEWLSVEVIHEGIAGEKVKAVAECLLKAYRRDYPGDNRRTAEHYMKQATEIVDALDVIDRRVVADIQRVPRLQSTEYLAGLCEFCLWQGEKKPFSKDGGVAADTEARKHLGDVHPEKVTYWTDPSVVGHPAF